MSTQVAALPRVITWPRAPALLMVAAWGLVGVGLAIANPWMFEALWVMALGPWFLWWMVGLWVMLAAASYRRDRPDWRIVGLTALVGAALWFGRGPLEHIGEWLRFESRVASYEAVLARLRAEPPAPGRMLRGESGGVRWIAEPGPPLRVAFVSDPGVIDNWSGYVWDPSGAVGQARGWSNGRAGDYTAPPAIHELFGGDIVACQPVRRDWWACSFT